MKVGNELWISYKNWESMGWLNQVSRNVRRDVPETCKFNTHYMVGSFELMDVSFGHI
jgi:hypothetical protein